MELSQSHLWGAGATPLERKGCVGGDGKELSLCPSAPLPGSYLCLCLLVLPTSSSRCCGSSVSAGWCYLVLLQPSRSTPSFPGLLLVGVSRRMWCCIIRRAKSLLGLGSTQASALGRGAKQGICFRAKLSGSGELAAWSPPKVSSGTEDSMGGGLGCVYSVG